MKYIHLNNDSYIINTSKGIYTMTKESFNFHKIKRLLSNNEEEEKILPLLLPTPLPNGVFKAYIIKDTDQMFYEHIEQIQSKITNNYFWLSGIAIDPPNNSKFVGIYASKEDLILDWPEYTI